MTTMHSWFGTDGVRGIANKRLRPELATAVGLAAGSMFRKPGRRTRVIVAKDTRLSGYMIEPALVAGLTATGMDVTLLGPVPTAGLALLVSSMRADLGIMITASHNPHEYSGMKFFGPDGRKLSDDREEEIERRLLASEAERNDYYVSAEHLGRAKRIEGVADRYVEAAKRTIPRGVRFDGLRVVIDCANGAAYRVAPQVLRELGVEAFPIGVEPDGFNINRDLGSTAPNQLRQQVLHFRADLGIALDGDADRVVVVDERGEIISADQVLAVIAHSWQEEGVLTSGGVVGTETTNSGLERYLASLKVPFCRTPVGDKHVIDKMIEIGASLGGEPTGHIIMAEHAASGDGLVSGLQVLAAMKKSGKKASELLSLCELLPQAQENVPRSNKNILDKPAVKKVIANAKQRLGKEGRVVVRYSGTEPVIRVMVECIDEAFAQELVNEIAATLRAGK